MANDATNPVFSIIAPVYNEEPVLETLYQRMSTVMDGTGESWELILIDDGSHDRSAEIIGELHARDPRVRGLSFSRNFGFQVAVSAGLDMSRGDAVVLIDADLQDPPEVIPEMAAKWRAGYDVVYGVRASREGETWFKLLTAKAFYRIIDRITGCRYSARYRRFSTDGSAGGRGDQTDARAQPVFARHGSVGWLQANGRRVPSRGAGGRHVKIHQHPSNGAVRRQCDHQFFVFPTTNCDLSGLYHRRD